MGFRIFISSIALLGPTIADASRCRCCGIPRPGPSSITSPKKSCACSTRRSMPLATPRSIFTPNLCAPKSIASIPSFTTVSTTASIAAASLPPRPPTRRHSHDCLTRSIKSNRGSPTALIWSAPCLQKRIGGCLLRWPASMRFTTGTSSATATASRIFRICRVT